MSSLDDHCGGGPSLQIGPYRRDSTVIVAPMAGVTDRPFRDLVRSFGAEWLVSEMVTSDPALWGTRKSLNRMRFIDEGEPRWVQIAGGDAQMLAHAAQVNIGLGAQIIDINMGCPAKKVCNKAAGSALLRDERLVAEILDAVVGAAGAVPVTLKIRTGWSREQRNAERVARIAESAGVALLTVHGRTREDRFAGSVDYDAIGRVKAAVSIPVIANGDITDSATAQRVLALTECDGVMVGRAVNGRPWLIRQLTEVLAGKKITPEPNSGEIKQVLIAHITGLAQFYGEDSGVRIARKHVGWYLREQQVPRDFLKGFNTLTGLAAQVEAINQMPSHESVAA